MRRPIKIGLLLGNVHKQHFKQSAVEQVNNHVGNTFTFLSFTRYFCTNTYLTLELYGSSHLLWYHPRCFRLCQWRSTRSCRDCSRLPTDSRESCASPVVCLYAWQAGMVHRTSWGRVRHSVNSQLKFHTASQSNHLPQLCTIHRVFPTLMKPSCWATANSSDVKSPFVDDARVPQEACRASECITLGKGLK